MGGASNLVDQAPEGPTSAISSQPRAAWSFRRRYAGRVVRLRWVGERRVLRRASHQSLKVPVFRDQSFDALSQITPADSYARGDWDADYRRGDREQTWYPGDAEHTAPVATVREMPRPEPAPMADISWDEASRRQQRTPPASTLTFKPAVRPWYGSQRVLILVLVAAVVAMIVAGVLLVLRSASDGTQDTTVTPAVTTSAVPPTTPSTPVGEEPLPPAEVPPPPPPPEETSSAPSGNGGGYRWYPPSGSDTPTGRPARPAPISVAPLPRPAPTSGHAAPGDGPPRHHRGFFG